MRTFEEAMASEMSALVRAGVPVRAVRITVREMLIARMERGPLGAYQVRDAVEVTVRTVCRLARELEAPDELVETVCRAALEAVRGHGGGSARWLEDAASAVYVVLDELALERPEETSWRYVARRLPRW